MKSKLLDKKTVDTIIEYISKGNYIKTACLAAGIAEETFYHWMRLAEDYNPDNGSASNKIYYEFSVLLKKAREQSVTSNVSLIQEAAKKPQNWPAAAWLLERTRPDDYAKREPTVIVESKVLLAIQQQAREDVKVLPPNEIDDTKQLGTVVEGEVVGGE